jgi:hypothetical protein
VPNSPIAIFGFNRPSHLERLLDSLAQNLEAKDSLIYFYIDGPRNANEQKLVEKVNQTAENFAINFNTRIIRSEFNLGLSKSVLCGIDQVFESHETIIVLEDDLVLGKHFLEFCNEGLKKYRSDGRVGTIQGYTQVQLGPKNPYFLPGADCWGWATWKDRWELLNRNSEELLHELEKRSETRIFDLKGSYPYTNMLRREAQKEVDSWAIRWHASMFLARKLSLCPGISLVENSGFDGSGTHTSPNSIKAISPYEHRIDLPSFEPRIEPKVMRQVIGAIRRRNRIYPVYHPLKYFYALKRRTYQLLQW